MELFELLSDIDSRILELTQRRSEVEAAIKEYVDAHGPAAGHGYEAGYAPARKSTDHKAAVEAQIAAGAVDKDHPAIAQHTKIKTTTSVEWAKVTKALRIPLDDFTVQPPPVFRIKLAD
jgi:hypothetical protein